MLHVIRVQISPVPKAALAIPLIGSLFLAVNPGLQGIAILGQKDGFPGPGIGVSLLADSFPGLADCSLRLADDFHELAGSFPELADGFHHPVESSL